MWHVDAAVLYLLLRLQPRPGFNPVQIHAQVLKCGKMLQQPSKIARNDAVKKSTMLGVHFCIHSLREGFSKRKYTQIKKKTKTWSTALECMVNGTCITTIHLSKLPLSILLLSPATQLSDGMWLHKLNPYICHVRNIILYSILRGRIKGEQCALFSI